jgi:hypothetical protein
VDSTAIDLNGWFGYSAVGNALEAHALIPDDDDLMTALVSATEGVSIKLVTQQQLQAECERRRIPRLGTKAELLARWQAHEAMAARGPAKGPVMGLVKRMNLRR